MCYLVHKVLGGNSGPESGTDLYPPQNIKIQKTVSFPLSRSTVKYFQNLGSGDQVLGLGIDSGPASGTDQTQR